VGGDYTDVDPAAVVPAAQRLAVNGQSLAETWQFCRREIEQINSQRPWGDDAIGREIERSYCGAGDPVGTALESGAVLSDLIADLGELAGMAAILTEMDDESAATAIDGVFESGG
jgi:hypothetical protein